MAQKRSSAPTPAQIKRLAKAHHKAEDALRHAEMKAALAKRSVRKAR
ncbi:MAG: hypothetical protein WC565_09665 [Parcubacteria group bacterium]|jgi:hypothetical protein